MLWLPCGAPWHGRTGLAGIPSIVPEHTKWKNRYLSWHKMRAFLCIWFLENNLSEADRMSHWDPWRSLSAHGVSRFGISSENRPPCNALNKSDFPLTSIWVRGTKELNGEASVDDLCIAGLWVRKSMGNILCNKHLWNKSNLIQIWYRFAKLFRKIWYRLNPTSSEALV